MWSRSLALTSSTSFAFMGVLDEKLQDLWVFLTQLRSTLNKVLAVQSVALRESLQKVAMSLLKLQGMRWHLQYLCFELKFYLAPCAPMNATKKTNIYNACRSDVCAFNGQLHNSLNSLNLYQADCAEVNSLHHSCWLLAMAFCVGRFGSYSGLWARWLALAVNTSAIFEQRLFHVDSFNFLLSCY